MNQDNGGRTNGLEERLSRFLDGELPREEARELERLLETSAEARETYAALTRLHGLCVEAFPRTHFVRPHVQTRRRWSLARLAAAAALAVVFGGLGWAAVRTWIAPSSPTQSSTATPASSEDSNAVTATPASSRAGTASDSQSVSPAEGADLASTGGGADGAPLTGIVTGPDQQPVANAEVRACREVADDWRIGAWHLEAVASCRTDASGRFSLRIPRDTTMLQIRAAGFASAIAPYSGTLQDATVELLAQLTEALHVTGRMASPVAGVRVVAGDQELTGAAPVITDESGNFDISTEWNGLWFFHPDYAIARVRDVQGDVRLERGGALRVRVVCAGAPVPGAYVRLDSDVGDIAAALDAPETSGFDASRRADEQGMVVYANLPAGEDFVVRARTESGHAAAVCRNVIVQAGGVTDCTVTMPRGYPAKVLGKVLYTDGEPAAGAKVMVLGYDDGRLDRLVRVAEDGSFDIGLEMGQVRLCATLGPGSGYLLVQGEDDRILEATAAATNFSEEFRFRRAESVWISLVDDSGQPVSSAFLQIGRAILPGPGMRFRVHAPEGRFSLSADVCVVLAYDPETGRGGVMGLKAGAREVRVMLDTPMGAIAGRVVDGDGNPLARVEVAAQGENDWCPNVTTDNDGRFRLEPQALDKDFSLAVSKEGYQLRPGFKLDPVRAAADPQPIIVVMLPADSGISGHVVALDGTPVPEARVAALDGDKRLAEVRTGADGDFSVALAPGAYTLSVYGLFVQGEQAGVVAPARDVVLTLPVPTAAPEPAAPPPEGPMQEKISNNLKQMGLVCKMFAYEHVSAEHLPDGGWPAMEPVSGAFYPELKAVYPEYLTDRSIMSMVKGQGEVKLCYLGYAVTDETSGLALLDAYEKLGPEAIYDQDVQVEQGRGSAGSDVVYRLREGVESHFLSDSSDTMEAGRALADIPVMWQIPDEGENSGGWVLYMDGHVEWRPYPGRFPMTEPFIKRIKGLARAENP